MAKQGPGPGDYDPKLTSDMVMSHVKEQKPITDRPESRGKSPAVSYHVIILLIYYSLLTVYVILI